MSLLQTTTRDGIAGKGMNNEWTNEEKFLYLCFYGFSKRAKKSGKKYWKGKKQKRKVRYHQLKFYGETRLRERERWRPAAAPLRKLSSFDNAWNWKEFFWSAFFMGINDSATAATYIL